MDNDTLVNIFENTFGNTPLKITELIEVGLLDKKFDLKQIEGIKSVEIFNGVTKLDNMYFKYLAFSVNNEVYRLKSLNLDILTNLAKIKNIDILIGQGFIYPVI